MPTILVNAPTFSATDLVRDSFARTESGSLGEADLGGLWTPRDDNSVVRSVDGTHGVYVGSSGTMVASDDLLVSKTDQDVEITVRTDAVVDNEADQYLMLRVRAVDVNNYYRAGLQRLFNAHSIIVQRCVGGSHLVLVSNSWSFAPLQPNTDYRIRVQAIGVNPTTIRVRMWPLSEPEPTTWLEVEDSSSVLQVPSGVGILARHVNSSVFPIEYQWDNLLGITPEEPFVSVITPDPIDSLLVVPNVTVNTGGGSNTYDSSDAYDNSNTYGGV